MNQRFNTVELTRMTLLTILICISTYTITPLPFTPTSLTAWALVVNLVTPLLTPRQATFTMVVYILLGLTGLPVFSGGMGGPGKPFGPTGDYIMSWVPVVMLMPWLKGKYYNSKRYCLVTILIGMPMIYLIGDACMEFMTRMDWAATFTAAVIPFIPLDILRRFTTALIVEPVQISLSDTQRAR